MKNLIFLFLFVFLVSAPAKTYQPKVDLDFTSMKISDYLDFLYKDTIGTNYVLSPEVLQDERKISLRVMDFKKKESLEILLKNLGYKLETKANVDYITSIQKQDDFEFYVYSPKHKSVESLKSSFAGLIAGQFSGDNYKLVFKGSKIEIEKLKGLLKKFDVQEKQVVLKGKIYEVSTKQSDGSSLSVIADIFKNAGVALSNGAKMANYLSFSNSDVNFYWSAISTDDRFNLISEPSLLAESHTTAKITVGNDVPTLGAVSYQDGQPIQSVEYRSSGIIFEITPEIYNQEIKLSVRQEISNFATTTNGVNNSPTLVKRELRTKINAKDKQMIILGGLIENKDTKSEAGLSFLPSWLGQKNKGTDKTEIILSLYVEVVE